MPGKQSPDKQGPWQRSLVKLVSKITGHVVGFFVSVVWTNTERPNICYKKYLGPDWKPTYDNASSLVVNHQSWTDILMLMQKTPPAFVSKAATRKVPFIGKIAETCGSIFIDRGNK